ncbi:FkbM family methyltransferase [bacterium]|nr:FkbM family methyltransferase [bacterium]
MKQYYRTIADEHFSEEPDVKIREELAEQFLVREYLEAEQGGYFVEVGANNPFDLSQTWHLAQQGWKGILVEPIPELCESLRTNRSEAIVVEAACGSPYAEPTALFTIAKDSGKSTLSSEFLDKRSLVDSQITVQVKTLDNILSSESVDSIDLVSIDVEGTQYDVLRGFDLQRWKPRLLLVEDHLLDTKTHKLIEGQQYQLVKRTLFNNWYIPCGATKPTTGSGENKILKGKMRRIPIRNLRFHLRRLLGKGI